MENFKAFLEFLKKFFNVTKAEYSAESSTSLSESLKKFFNVTVKAVTLTKDAIIGIIFLTGMYFVGIEIVSWIGEKLFYDFDKLGELFLRGEYFKGIVLLITMFIAYDFIASLFVNSDNGISVLALLVALAVLVFWVGSDIYQCYQYYHNTLDRVVTIGMYLAASFNEVLKIITIVWALSLGSSKY